MNKQPSNHGAPPFSTGIAGLDDVLCGPLDLQILYLSQGEPGAGKTAIALQFLLDGAGKGEEGLYDTLSESESDPSLRSATSCGACQFDRNLAEANAQVFTLSAEAR